MADLIYILKSCILLLTFNVGANNAQNVSEDYLQSIDATLIQMNQMLESIITFLSPQICSESLEDLTNAESNWNPNATYVAGDTVTIFCKNGTKTRRELTEQTISCLRGNEWSIFQRCEYVCAKQLNNLRNAEVFWDSNAIYFEGSIITATCIEGFKTQTKGAKQTLECLSGGVWSPFETCDEICQDPFKRENNLCLLVSRKRTWKEAVQYCKKMNSSLAVLKTDTEIEAFRIFLQRQGISEAWLGASDYETKDDWWWIDDTKVNSKFPYSNFWPTTGQYCLYYRQKQGFIGVPCYHYGFPACQMKL